MTRLPLTERPVRASGLRRVVLSPKSPTSEYEFAFARATMQHVDGGEFNTLNRKDRRARARFPKGTQFLRHYRQRWLNSLAD